MVSCFAWKLKQCHPPQGIADLDMKSEIGESSLSGRQNPPDSAFQDVKLSAKNWFLCMPSAKMIQSHPHVYQIEVSYPQINKRN